MSAAEAGTVAAFNLAGFLIGALAAPWLRRRMEEAALLRACLWITLACLVASIAPAGAVWLIFWRGVRRDRDGRDDGLRACGRHPPRAAGPAGRGNRDRFHRRRDRDPRLRRAGAAAPSVEPCHGVVGARAVRRGGRGGGALGMAGRDPGGDAARPAAIALPPERRGVPADRGAEHVRDRPRAAQHLLGRLSRPRAGREHGDRRVPLGAVRAGRDDRNLPLGPPRRLDRPTASA